jgi:hypothetical protein
MSWTAGSTLARDTSLSVAQASRTWTLPSVAASPYLRGVDLRRIVAIAALALGVLASPLAVEAQQAGRVYRLGILSPGAVPDPSVATSPNLVPMALRGLGYIEGQNLVVERRFAEGKIDRLPVLARELVQLRVDVIVAVSEAVQAAKDATATIPIVMGFGFNPVEQGFVALPVLAATSLGFYMLRKVNWWASGWS